MPRVPPLRVPPERHWEYGCPGKSNFRSSDTTRTLLHDCRRQAAKIAATMTRHEIAPVKALTPAEGEPMACLDGPLVAAVNL